MWLRYITAIERLTDLSYIQIAPHQFAKKGYVFHHQEHKWRNKPLLGLGVSAYGYINNTAYHNVRSIQDYCDTVHQENLPAYVGKKLTKKEQMTRAMIFGLKLSGVNRRDGGLNIREFERTYNITVKEMFDGTLNRLQKLELIKEEGGFIQLTYKGILFSDEVCREFYSPQEKEYLKQIGCTYGRGIF